MDNVEDLAGRTGQEVAEWRATLNNHTELLNAIRDDHVDQGKELVKLKVELADVRSEMRKGFGKLAKGQELITDLLTRHLGDADKEPPAGGAGE